MDTGYLKTVFFSLGVLLFFISNYFITYENYIECSLNLFFKHIAIMTIIMVYSLFIGFNAILGTKFDMKDEGNIKNASNKSLIFTENDFNISESIIKSTRRLSIDIGKEDLNENNVTPQQPKEDKSNEYSVMETLIMNNIINKQIEKRRSLSFEVPNGYITKVINSRRNSIAHSFTEEEKENKDIKENKNLVLEKSLKITHSLFIFNSSLYIISILTLVFIIIYNIRNTSNIYITNENNDNVIQNIHGDWSYECNLEKSDLVMNSIEFMFFITILIRGRSIYNYYFIFRCTQYITYSSGVIVILGPIINVNFK